MCERPLPYSKHMEGVKTYSDAFNRRVDWAQKPGFWDPYSLCQICVPCIMKDVYFKQKYTRYDSDLNIQSIPDPQVCPGIQIYFQQIEIRPEIKDGVERYIAFPCKEVPKNLVHEKPESALQFLLHYLRLRGPFIHWNVDESDASRASLTTGTHLISWVDNYLSTLPELDMVALILVGKYLSYLQHVACGHKMFFMKEIISKVWGPLFIRLKLHKNVEHQYSRQDRIDIPIKIFQRMLSICPWDRYKPFESTARAVHPTLQFHSSHKYQELAQDIITSNTVPMDLKNHAGTFAYEELQARGPYEDEIAKLSNDERVRLSRTPYASDVPFPPDHCNISYGAPADMEHYK